MTATQSPVVRRLTKRVRSADGDAGDAGLRSDAEDCSGGFDEAGEHETGYSEPEAKSE